ILKEAKVELEKRVEERTVSLAIANEQIKQISFQLIKAEEKERIRIAGELHDQVGQSLLLAKMKVDALSCCDLDHPELESATEISSLLSECIQDIRTLTFAMRPHLLDTAGLEAALEWLCKSIYENYQLKVDFSTNSLSNLLDSEQRYSLYQAVRELLLNVAKHSGVNYAELSLKTDGNKLIIQVSDKGVGFETKSRSCSSASDIGLGLFNVQQRIELMGGSCWLESKPGQGTLMTLTIPLGE
ncbi:MAG: sensor histidine kinase, partial [Methanothrix sp.]